jgi:aspartate oxidase
LKTKKTSKSKTPSFVCEVSLQVTRQQERILEARFEAGRQLYNALLGEAKKRLALVRQSVWFTLARKARTKKSGRLTLWQQDKRMGFLRMPLKRWRITCGAPLGLANT